MAICQYIERVNRSFFGGFGGSVPYTIIIGHLNPHRVKQMGDQKDIADMSFEEFFSETKRDVERKENKKAAAQAARDEKPTGIRGFLGATPKINFNNGKFLLYVPRYEGHENDSFNVAVECGDRIVPMHRLEYSKQRGARVTKPATIDLTPAEVTPMDSFVLTIDGERAFENKARPIAFYNNIGSPMPRPIGEVTAVCRVGTKLKLSKAEIISSAVKNGLAVYQVNVFMSGAVMVDESVSAGSEDACADAAPEQEAPAEAVKESVKEKVPAKKPSRKAVKGDFAISQPSQDADIIFDGRKLPLYAEAPIITLSIKGCEPEECVVRAEGKDGELLSIPGASKLRIDTKEYGGPLTIILEKGAKVLYSQECFVIPDFKCSYSGKGDITEDTKVEYTMFGQTGTKDVSEDDPYSFEFGGMKFKAIWCVPYVTYDVGNGPKVFDNADMDILSIKSDKMKVTVRGARKKALFFGGETGKKRDITPDWDGETFEVDVASIRDEILASSSSAFCIYITVNSCPNRKFMTLRNPVRMTASFDGSDITVNVDESMKDCICRLYKIDKSIEDVPMNAGTNIVRVAPDVIEAEAVEMYNGSVRTSVPVKIRQMPFINRDQMGDKWMYVSREKRIPLPDDLYKDGEPVMSNIKKWHELIVRMNPELKGVTFEMIQKAFKEAN